MASAGKKTASRASRDSKTASQAYNVLVRGCPKALCTAAMAEVMLEQAGVFDGKITSCKVDDRSPHGEFVVAVKCWNDVNRCIGHFDGCSWGGKSSDVRCTATPVSKFGGSSSDEGAPVQANFSNKGFSHFSSKTAARSSRPSNILTDSPTTQSQTSDALESSGGSTESEKEGSSGISTSDEVSLGKRGRVQSTLSTVSSRGTPGSKARWADVESDSDDDFLLTPAFSPVVTPAASPSLTPTQSSPAVDQLDPGKGWSGEMDPVQWKGVHPEGKFNPQQPMPTLPFASLPVSMESGTDFAQFTPRDDEAEHFSPHMSPAVMQTGELPGQAYPGMYPNYMVYGVCGSYLPMMMSPTSMESSLDCSETSRPCPCLWKLQGYGSGDPTAPCSLCSEGGVNSPDSQQAGLGNRQTAYNVQAVYDGSHYRQ